MARNSPPLRTDNYPVSRLWARLLLAAVCAVSGVVLTLRPFTSLAALVLFVAGAFLASGISELVGARDAGTPALAATAGLGSHGDLGRGYQHGLGARHRQSAHRQDPAGRVWGCHHH